MKKAYCFILLSLLCLLAPGSSFAQGENNIWVFGDSLGLDFNGGGPAAMRTPSLSSECPATVCDADGRLLFYYGGRDITEGGMRRQRYSVSDKTHTVMPNGMDILGNKNTSGMMGSCIVPFPDGSNRYYLFTAGTMEDYTGPGSTGVSYLRYSVVDLSLRAGLGDVDPLYKNVVIDSFPGETMVVAQGNDCSVWLITNNSDVLQFNAYKISPAGLDHSPVVSSFASGSALPGFVRSYLALSPNGKLLAFANTVQRKIELYDFDKNTGRFSNQRTVEDAYTGYALQFSPAGTKLYACYIGTALAQYDLTLLPSVPAVGASKYIVYGSATGLMRTGPDQKLYTFLSAGSLWRVNEPEAAGAACDFTDYAPATSRYISGFGARVVLPGTLATSYSRRDTAACPGTEITINAPPGYNGYTWADGTTGSRITLSAPGRTWVRMRKNCTVHIDTIVVAEKWGKMTQYTTDSTFCFVTEARISAPAAYRYYLWNDHTTDTTKVFTPGDSLKWVRTVLNEACDLRTDTIKAHFINFQTALPSGEALCPGGVVVLNASIEDDAHYEYRWQDGSSGPVFTAKDTGDYTVTIVKQPCTLRHTVQIHQTELALNLGKDQWACAGSTVKLQAAHDYDRYRWQDGSTQASIELRQSGMYWLQVDKGACSVSDTVQVTFSDCRHCIVIPNAFTPNSDGRNDVFRPLLQCPTQRFDLKIFNRYGEQVFHTTEPTHFWNGDFNGREEGLGVYFYLLKVCFDYPGATDEMYKGNVSLLR
ncbi:MAG: gliding motility-associated C-terminal domain-containing protein [Chitinophagaceae bacterium]|nr:gliding motility-associated C-terminal domain-containing protein [Chitinophagaceae bacterium]